MLRLALVLILIPFADAAARDRGGDFDACNKSQVDFAKNASGYHGEDRIKQLIDADLTRARREEAEGDADECLEALDHAKKLIADQY
ncbi:hypothetical protein [Rhodopila sp.]|uniref:hypothetical protein n=1 Tax=Rhodopila sp. TaxID=2480087 RepID=UPI003D0B4474